MFVGVDLSNHMFYFCISLINPVRDNTQNKNQLKNNSNITILIINL